MSSETQTGPWAPVIGVYRAAQAHLTRKSLTGATLGALRIAVEWAFPIVVMAAIVAPAALALRAVRAYDQEPPDLDALVPVWFFGLYLAAWILCATLGRIVARRLVFRHFRWPSCGHEPPTAARLDLLGRRWPYIVAASYAAVFVVVTVTCATSIALAASLDWAIAALLWLPFLPGGCLQEFIRGRRDDLLGPVLSYESPPWTGDLRYDEAGFHARIERYKRWARFYEEHHLLCPSPRVFTDRQCQKIKEGYESLQMHIEAWAEGEMRPAPRACLDPVSR